MTDWQRFWSEYHASVGEHQMLRQVGHTIDGEPYSVLQFEAMVASICDALELGHGHKLLDVCCGNGIVTKVLAEHCSEVLGIDFSPSLIDTAKRHHSRNNVTYR